MRWSIVLFIGLAAAAAAQDAGDYVPVEQSDCWTCHSPQSGDDKPMAPAYAIDPGYVVLAGGPLALEPKLVNTWLAELHEVHFELDISDAPSLAFQGGSDPFQAQLDGRITVDVTSTDWQTAHIDVDIPSGATAVRVVLEPTGTLPADLRLQILDKTAFVTQDAAGPGGAETVTLDAAALAGHSLNWTIEAGYQTVRDASIDAQLGEIPFGVTVDAWYNASTATSLSRYADGPILPRGSLGFPFALEVGDPQPGESITMNARMRMFYEHGDATVDEWWLILSETYTLENDGPDVVLGTQAIVVPAPIADGLGVDRVAEIIGYAAAFLMLASIASGGIFGKRSRRGLNLIFGSARRRVAFHNFLSYGIMVAAIAHLVIFLIETNWHWAWGLLWGGSGILCLFLLGFTGAMQAPIIRRWNYKTWRWTHFAFAIAAIVFTIVHVLLDGSHFSAFSDSIGWQDPLVPAERQ